MNFKAFAAPLMAGALVAATAGAALAQNSVNPNFSAPMPTGSAGNSNTGPQGMPGGQVKTPGIPAPAMQGTQGPGPNASSSMVPAPTGSAGNSKTGPATKP
jgi:hypothetical protein